VFAALGTRGRHAMRLHQIVVCGLSSTIFSTLSNKRQAFLKKVTERKMCVFIVYTVLSPTLIILTIIQLDINVHASSIKVAIIVLIFERNFKVVDRFSKNTQNIKFYSSCPVRADFSM
jgi:hypothetical protein